jgi:hypothetical protein
MSQTVSIATVALLKQLDHEALATCLYAACDLALRASRGSMPVPPPSMTADDLVRQIVSDMPARTAPVAPTAAPL